MNSQKNTNLISTRMHNLTFGFEILSFDESITLRWIQINNYVSKCFIKYPDHTLEITRSPNEDQSILQVHLSEEYVFDPLKGLITQYNKARKYASLASQRLRIVIADDGELVKKLHMAFEHDVIALSLLPFKCLK